MKISNLSLYITLSFFCINSAQAIVINGKDWRQVTDTDTLTYGMVDTIYDNSTGQLLDAQNTIVNGINFSGYTWASAQEVADLFSTITGQNIQTATGLVDHSAQSVWAPAFFDTYGFNFFGSATDARGLTGYTRTQIQPGSVSFAHIQDVNIGFGQDLISFAFDVPEFVHNIPRPGHGYWLYSPVPVPAAVWLFGSGLLGLFGVRIRKQNRVNA